LVETFAQVFSDERWVVERREQMRERGLSFDFAAENDAAIVFVREIPFEVLDTEATRLSAEIAATLRRQSIGAKVWEGYLLLLCEGEARQYEKSIQDAQHDLSYCRKLVLSNSDIREAPDPYLAARNKIGFLFPLTLSPRSDIGDVRRAIVTRLSDYGIPPGLATALVAKFDEAVCDCYDRLLAAEADRGVIE
jgi:hypothetical protein